MRKTLSLFLAFALLLSLTVSAFAISPNAKISSMTDSLALGYSGSVGGSVDLGDVRPQDERVVYINLYDTMFTWEGSELPDPASPALLTQSQIRTAKLDVKLSRQNSKVIDSVSVNSRDSRIEVKFNKVYVATKAVDFDCDIILTIDGRRQNDHAINLSGTFGNEVVELYADDSGIDISDGSVGEAMEYISKLEADIGNGVIVSTRLTKGKSVYGTSTFTPDNKDDEVMKEYKDISEVITLNTVGLNNSGSTVKLGAEYRNSYVYDKELKLLGKGSDALAYSDKYYLSAKELDVDSGSEDPTTPVKDAQPTDTPANEVSGNVNHNPNTGR